MYDVDSFTGTVLPDYFCVGFDSLMGAATGKQQEQTHEGSQQYMSAYPVHNLSQHSLQLKNLHPVISVGPITDVHPSEVRLVNQLVIGQVLADIFK